MWFVKLFTSDLILQIGFPYSPWTAPQRLWVVHTKRTFHDSAGNAVLSDAGVLVEKMDYHDAPELLRAVPALAASGVSLEADCARADFINCGVPFNGPRLSRSSKRYARNDCLFVCLY